MMVLMPWRAVCGLPAIAFFCKKRDSGTPAGASAVPNVILLFQMMLPAESFAHPVHPAPQQDGKHKVDRVFQGADQRLPKDSHHGHHQPLAQKDSAQVALFVKVRHPEGKVHEGGGGEGQQRQHEQGRGIEAVHPLLCLFQLGGAAGYLPEKALDEPPPE